MTGFLKRDYYLISGNLKFYALFMAAFALVVRFTEMQTSFLSIYVVIFAMSSVTGLFSYDDMNRWTAYGAAAPSGRIAMVDARYLLTILLTAGLMFLQLLVSLLGREPDALPATAAYGGIFLLYAAISLPVCYHFGGTKARTVMIVMVAVVAAVVGMGSAALSISGAGGFRLPSATLLLPLVGIAALAVSWRISLGIMGRKEL